MKPIIEIQHISKKFNIRHQHEPYLSLRESISSLFRPAKTPAVYEEFYALADVSFELQAGESMGIIGKNGAGKSTLLKILSKISPPSSGKIICRGRIASLLEVGTGFHQELSGRENIFLNGSILGMRRHEILKHFDAIVDFAGTEKFLDTPLKRYSSGMQLRLAFAVAAFLEPEIMIIDEVLAVGDAEFQKKCLGKMEEVGKMGRSILFVSHNMAAVKSLCKTAILLERGRIAKSGDTGPVIEKYLNDEKKEELPLQIRLNDEVSLNDFVIKQRKNGNNGMIDYSFTIESKSVNPVTGISVLIDNSMNERIGILDLRSQELSKLSAAKKSIQFNGTINHIPLVEGTYYLGLYLSSVYCHHHIYRIASFEVQPRTTEVIPFELQYRGYVEFDHITSVQ
jgi:lipopolysaccharide transport system ATP-binding protein